MTYGSAPHARTYRGWAESFAIFAKYSEPDHFDHVAAEHDEIYAGPNPAVVSVEDRLALEALCWRADEKLHCFARCCT